MDILLDVRKHLKNFQVGAAVLRSLQRAKRCRDGRIGVRSRRGNDVRRKGRVISSAMLRVQDQCDIQHLRLKLCILAVRVEHLEQILCQ